jgi:hypothetical protein
MPNFTPPPLLSITRFLQASLNFLSQIKTYNHPCT